ncbi:hypothetical protein [Nocardia macrotermitis]|uniref:Uncharacterized protein n=1 Tax=Nocardia macrotermitis TaxID=2585198 RepID=A0A7K0D099_9NOCA|nr:hypothetical protein [Nocardia macrotermitis]MQY19108.1 hypothetical protein [Nocardia macrotermitis]
MSSTPNQDDRTPRPARAGGSARSAADAAKLARIFGETLPQTTSDERGPDGEFPTVGRSSDEWLRSQVPPHHG